MRGTTTSDVGNATINPMRKPLNHTTRNVGIRPTLINVKTNDIVNDIKNDINTANKTVEYFLLIFIVVVNIFVLISPLKGILGQSTGYLWYLTKKVLLPIAHSC